ncbi:MAG: hypothetical protein J2P36_37675 [Ktedonobacteraceae bacterium]|nr:hypothetical protein [Ktedonobacteraceae bacterium]
MAVQEWREGLVHSVLERKWAVMPLHYHHRHSRLSRLHHMKVPVEKKPMSRQTLFLLIFLTLVGTFVLLLLEYLLSLIH